MSAKLVPLRRIAGEVSELSDEALVAASATGDTAALGALFDRFNVAVYRFLARLPHDAAARDDLVQATFLQVQRSAGKFRGGSAVKTWVLGIAANVARRQARTDRRRHARQGVFLVESQGTEVMSPDVVVDRQRLLAKLGEALRALPYKQQVAFVLCDLEQVPGTEAARVLGIPEGTLWRRVHQARKALRAAMQGS